MVDVVLGRVLEVVLDVGVGAGVDQDGVHLPGARIARSVVDGKPPVLWKIGESVILALHYRPILYFAGAKSALPLGFLSSRIRIIFAMRLIMSGT